MACKAYAYRHAGTWQVVAFDCDGGSTQWEESTLAAVRVTCKGKGLQLWNDSKN